MCKKWRDGTVEGWRIIVEKNPRIRFPSTTIKGVRQEARPSMSFSTSRQSSPIWLWKFAETFAWKEISGRKKSVHEYLSTFILKFLIIKDTNFLICIRFSATESCHSLGGTCLCFVKFDCVWLSWCVCV